MIPLCGFSAPGILRDSQRRDNEYLTDLEAVVYQLVDRGQCDDCLTSAQAHR